MNADLIATLVKYAVMFGVFINVAPIMNWVERRACAYIQDRPGPNRVGPLGLFQPLADAAKFMFKEDVTPAAVDKLLYLMAPVLGTGRANELIATVGNLERLGPVSGLRRLLQA